MKYILIVKTRKGTEIGIMGPFDSAQDALNLADAHSDRLKFSLRHLMTDRQFVDVYKSES